MGNLISSSNINISNDGYINRDAPMDGSVTTRLASPVPDLRQTTNGISPTRQMPASARYDQNHPAMQIYSPSMAPSAISTENALTARSLFTPIYIHDSAACKMARISNSQRDAPRFSGKINMLA
ncbi:MAG: hypothetical protein QMB16_03290 [Paracoccaceae bacterium]